MKRMSDVAIAGVCGKFARPENTKEGLHLLAEMGADTQLESCEKEHKAEMIKLFEEIEFIITHLDSIYGFINKLKASPDYQALKEKWVK